MKNKIFLALLLTLGAVGAIWGTTVVYSDYLANETVGYAKDYVLDLKLDGSAGRAINSVSATAIISSGTLAAVTFTDGGCSTGSFTVSSLTGINGTYAVSSMTVTSTSSLKNAWVKFNDKKLRNGYEWKVKATTTLTAKDIARIMNYITVIQATNTANVVYATATTAGEAGNEYTLTASTTLFTISSSPFAGGADPAYISIAGVSILSSTYTKTGCFVPVATTTGTAQAIVNAINANTTLADLLTATRSGSDVLLTADTVGENAYALYSNFSGIVASSDVMTGGSSAAYTIDEPTIYAEDHGLTTGLPVLYATGSAVAIGGLTNGTTYYAINVDDNNFQLAATSTGAIAGTYITLTSSSTVGPHDFTLTPTASSGTWGAKWQVSDDDTNWYSISVDSVTFATPYTSTTTFWDLGTLGHRYLRFHIDEGTGGSINVKCYVTGKNEI